MPLAGAIQSQYQVRRVDLPGYGGSEWVESGFSEQVTALARCLPPGGTLVGWSMGGLYAIELAHRFPGRFDRLVLVSSNPCFVARQDWLSAMPEGVFNEFANSLIDDWQVTIRRFIGLQVHGMPDAREMIREVSRLIVAGGAPAVRTLQFGLDLLLTSDLRSQLASLHLPVMAVLGRRDKLVPASLADELPRVSPEIRVECLHRSAHTPFLSHRQSFLELLNEFVESTPSGQIRDQEIV